jgi:hypothetical protein
MKKRMDESWRKVMSSPLFTGVMPCSPGGYGSLLKCEVVSPFLCKKVAFREQCLHLTATQNFRLSSRLTAPNNSIVNSKSQNELFDA